MNLEEEIFEQIRAELRKKMTEDPDTLNKYHTSGVWTPVIKSLVESVLFRKYGQTCSKESLVLKHEYLKLDSLIYQLSYKDHKGDFVPYENHPVEGNDFWLYKRKYLVAVEYENGNSIWADEIDKLAHIRCELKILVAYSPRKGGDFDKYLSGLETKVELVEEAIKEIEPEALNDKWLLLFLPVDALDLDYAVAFKMVGGKFCQIAIEPIE